MRSDQEVGKGIGLLGGSKVCLVARLGECLSVSRTEHHFFLCVKQTHRVVVRLLPSLRPNVSACSGRAATECRRCFAGLSLSDQEGRVRSIGHVVVPHNDRLSFPWTGIGTETLANADYLMPGCAPEVLPAASNRCSGRKYLQLSNVLLSLMTLPMIWRGTWSAQCADMQELLTRIPFLRRD